MASINFVHKSSTVLSGNKMYVRPWFLKCDHSGLNVMMVSFTGYVPPARGSIATTMTTTSVNGQNENVSFTGHSELMIYVVKLLTFGLSTV